MRPNRSTAVATIACAARRRSTRREVSATASPPAATISSTTVCAGPGVGAVALDRPAEVVDDDLRPARGQQAGVAAADAAAGAGDDRHPAVEAVRAHPWLLPSVDRGSGLTLDRPIDTHNGHGPSPAGERGLPGTLVDEAAQPAPRVLAGEALRRSGRPPGPGRPRSAGRRSASSARLACRRASGPRAKVSACSTALSKTSASSTTRSTSPMPQRLLGGHAAAGQDQVLGPGQADDVREPLGAARAGHDPERHLGQAEHRRLPATRKSAASASSQPPPRA